MKSNPIDRYRVLACAAAMILCGSVANAQLPEHFYFQFNEGSGTSTLDMAYPGLGSSPTFGSDWLNNSVMGNASLWGRTASGFLETNVPTTISGDWTIEFWTKQQESSSINYLFGDKSAGNFRCFSGGNAGPTGLLLRGPFNDVSVANAVRSDSGWTHVAFVYDESALRITPYVHGIAQPYSPQSSPIVLAGTQANGLQIGGLSGISAGPCYGAIEEFRFWSHARTPSQLLDNSLIELTELVDTFPYKEDFDSFGNPAGHGVTSDLQNGWHQDQSDGTQDWYFGSSTPTVTSGPETYGLGDRTSTSSLGVFGYIEDSVDINEPINLLSPFFDLRSLATPKMRVFVSAHDYANPVPTLFNPVFVDILSNGSVVSAVGSIVADTGDKWLPIVVDLSPFAGQVIRVQIRSTTVSPTIYCDSAIDDFQLIDAPLSDIIGQAPVLGISSFKVVGSENIWGDDVEQGHQLNGPYVRKMSAGQNSIFRMRGRPNQGFLMISGPLNPRVATFPGFGQFDIGALPLNSDGIPNLLVLEGDGITTPVLGLNNIFVLSGSGHAEFSFQFNGLPLGVFTTLQCIMLNPATIISFSNAVTLVVE